MFLLTGTELALICYLACISIGLLMYLIVPKKLKWIVLLVLSISFSIVLTSYWTIFLILIIIISYFSAFLLNKNIKKYKEIKDSLDKENKKIKKKEYKKKNKIILSISVIIEILILALLKYFKLPIGTLNNLFLSASIPYLGIAFPLLGISYYTLTSISYIVDVYRERIEANLNIFKLGLFISYFPSLLEGPFNRYDKLSSGIYKETNPSFDNIINGIILALWGLFFKVVVADRIGLFTNEVYDNPLGYSGITTLLALILYVFKLYFDFLGFIELARGVSMMFGIDLPINFALPLLSSSTAEFWRKWHITLGEWFKDYIYYPIALSKPMVALNKKIHGKVSTSLEPIIMSLIPTFFVWLACGIWHGAGSKYIIYGMYYFVVIVLEMFITLIRHKIFKKDHWYITIIGTVRTLFVVLIGMTLFRAQSLENFKELICNVFKSSGTKNINDIIGQYELIVMLVAVSLIIIYELFKYFMPNYSYIKLSPIIKALIIIILMIVTVIFGVYGGTYVTLSPEYAAF